MDIFIFGISLIFVDNEHQALYESTKDYRNDRFGYSWRLEE